MDFYYDYVSPNAYLAWQPVRELAARYGRTLAPRPVLFTGLLRAHGQAGPAEVAPKAQWMMRNCLRKAHELGIPLRAPHAHPFNPLLGLRVTLVCDERERCRLTDLLFRAVWAESRDVSDANLLSRLLSDAGFDGSGLVQAASGAAAKQQLREATDTAIASGVFGVPTMIVDGQLFFGYDDLPWLERYLRGEDTIGADELAAWAAIRPSAWRRER